jgi:hypothetical protein
MAMLQPYFKKKRVCVPKHVHTNIYCTINQIVTT